MIHKYKKLENNFLNYSRNVSAFTCDITSAQSLAAFSKFAVASLKTVHIWINGAAVNANSAPLLDIPEEELHSVVNTNIIGTALACRAAFELMMKQEGGGQIINIAGAGAQIQATPLHTPYGCTNAAIAQMTTSLASEVSAETDNIGVHLISPGVMMPTKLLLGKSKRINATQVKMFNALSELPEDVAINLAPKIHDLRGNNKCLRYRSRFHTLLMLVSAYILVPWVPAFILRLLKLRAQHDAFHSDGTIATHQQQQQQQDFIVTTNPMQQQTKVKTSQLASEIKKQN